MYLYMRAAVAFSFNASKTYSLECPVFLLALTLLSSPVEHAPAPAPANAEFMNKPAASANQTATAELYTAQHPASPLPTAAPSSAPPAAFSPFSER